MTTQWELRFDKEFPEIGHRHDEGCEFICHFRSDIHNFIASLLSHDRQSLKEKMEKELYKNPNEWQLERNEGVRNCLHILTLLEE